MEGGLDSPAARKAMPEFHILRIACACGEVWLASLRPGRWLSVLLLVSAAWHAIPAQVYSPLWLRSVQMPVLVLLLVLSSVISLHVFGWMDRIDRRYLLMAAIGAGGIPVLAGWKWGPENCYQAVMLARQYVVMGVGRRHGVGLGLGAASRPG